MVKYLLLLGKNKEAHLLVEVTNRRSVHDFDFSVVNGCWDGVFYCGHVSVLGCPGGSYTDLDITEILCDNQYFLHGHYNDVFNNYKSGWKLFPPTKNHLVNVDYEDDNIPF